MYLLPALLLTLVHTALAEDKPCTLRSEGKYYDLSPLTSKNDYEYTDKPSGRTFKLNVCDSVHSETWKVVGDVQNVGVYYRDDHGDFALGQSNTTLRFASGKINLDMNSGSPCSSSDSMRAATLLWFECDESVYGRGSPELVTSHSSCSYFFNWRTHYACPTHEPGSWAHFFAILIVLVLILGASSFIGVILYRRYSGHKRGLRQLPDINIPDSVFQRFSDLLERIQDFFREHFSRDPWGGGSRSSRGWSSRRGNGGFERLAASAEEAQSMMPSDGRFSIDDEDDREDARLNPTSEPSIPAGMNREGVIRL